MVLISNSEGSIGLVGSAPGFGSDDPGLTLCLCVTTCILPRRILITGQKRQPIEYQVMDKPWTTPKTNQR